MARRFLVVGDNHGDTESLRRVLDDTAGETFDYAIHVGDFTRALRDARTSENDLDPAVRGAQQLRAVEPLLSEFDDRARHGLLWVYGNQDLFGDLEYALDVGTEIPNDGAIEVGGQRFTSDLEAVDPQTVLVTHMEHWRLLDHFDGLAHFCGNTHRGRHLDRRLNSSFLRLDVPDEGLDLFGGYFVVTIGAEDERNDDEMDVEMRSIGSLERVECPIHGERGVQFLPASWECMYCDDPRNLWREMCATAFYGLTKDSDRRTVEGDELLEYAANLLAEPPADFRADFAAFLDDVDEDRYAPLRSTEDGKLTLAERTYAY